MKIRSILSMAIGCGVFAATACTTPASRVHEGSPRATADAAIAAEIDRFADSVIRSVPVAGISIVVSRGAQTVVSKGYGVADISTNRPMTESTASRIGSLTKVFTAIAIMKLVERGSVDLDADIRQFLPELTLPPVTVRQALNHTSGLPDYERAAVSQWLSNRTPITREFVTGILAREPAKPRGETWGYNNAGFYLLGLVIEKVSGITYEEFVEREIARPLQMPSTWMLPRRPANAVETVNYYLVDGRFVRDSLWDLPGIWASGGMFSTASDLARLLRAFATGSVVSDGSRAQMLRPTVLPTGARADYGFGIRLGAIAGHPKWGHTGSARSTRAAAAYYPRDSLAVVVLMNTEHEDLPIMATDIEGRVARIATGISTRRREDLKLAPGTSGAYTGIYADAAVQSLITERDGVLLFSRVGSTSAPIPLLYQGGDEWADPEFAEFRFVFQKRGDSAIAFGRYDNGWFVGVRSREK